MLHEISLLFSAFSSCLRVSFFIVIVFFLVFCSPPSPNPDWWLCKGRRCALSKGRREEWRWLMRMRCSLARAEVTFTGGGCWLRCWLRFWSRCCLRCWSRCCLAVWWGFRRAASNADTSDALAGFSVLSEMLHPDDRVHWRIFRFCQKCCILMIECIDGFDDDVRNAAPWWSIGLAVFRFCQRAASDSETVRCIDGFSMMSERLHPDDRVHWRVFDFVRELHLTLRRSDALADFLFVWRRQVAGRQTGGATRRQMRRCLLAVKAGKPIRERWWKTTI